NTERQSIALRHPQVPRCLHFSEAKPLESQENHEWIATAIGILAGECFLSYATKPTNLRQIGLHRSFGDAHAFRGRTTKKHKSARSSHPGLNCGGRSHRSFIGRTVVFPAWKKR